MSRTKTSRHYTRPGFTILELLVVIAILGIISATAFPAYQTIKQNITLSNTVQEIVSSLRTAQSRSLTSHEGTLHGIHFSTDAYTLYGGSWASPTYSQSHMLETGIQILSGAPDEVEFERLTGRATALTLDIGFPGGKYMTVLIDPSGRITTL